MAKLNLVTGIGIGVVVAVGLTVATSLASPSIEDLGRWAAEQTPGESGVVGPNSGTAPASRQSQGFSAACPASNVWTLELQEINGQRTARVLDQPGCTVNPANTSDEARLRGYVVSWMLQNCADNRPGEEANFRHYQLGGFTSYKIQQTGEATWSFRSGSETWYITERPSVTVTNPHGNDWCLK